MCRDRADNPEAPITTICCRSGLTANIFLCATADSPLTVKPRMYWSLNRESGVHRETESTTARHGVVEDAVRDACDLRHLGDVVHANDMRTAQDACRDGRRRSPYAFFRGCWLAFAGERHS